MFNKCSPVLPGLVVVVFLYFYVFLCFAVFECALTTLAGQRVVADDGDAKALAVLFG